MRHSLRAEWTKVRTLRGNTWLAVGIAVCTVLAAAGATAAVSTAQCPTVTTCYEDTARLALRGVWLGQALVVVFAVLMMSNEYGTGMIRTTLAVMPRRVEVLFTKAAVILGIVLATGAMGVLGSLLVGNVIMPANGFTPANGYPPLSLADGPTFRATFGTVLYLALIALLALGVTTVLRDTAVSITAILGLLYVVPVMSTFVTDPEWLDRLRRISPMTAGLAIQATRDLDRLPIGPWPGLGVLAAYAAVAMIIGGVIFVVREA
ncbi:ABC transporter permease subunit [Sphaerisporangium rubeum]|uniref:ABC-2 type transport system permease protein n=1 Tax=Sphaerisporangium rubeum TaxID=321317 RepID=A0A7X0ILC3_9ACTN|nr:ABC transporter permease [Sphaerisporangium rubeum]MBB6475827.1 ABC-2 type transport system permease protein [Sphaerisporangium rubeum]